MATQLDKENSACATSQIHELNLLLNSNMEDSLQAANDAKIAVIDFIKQTEKAEQEFRSMWDKQIEEYLNRLNQVQADFEKRLLTTSEDVVEKLTKGQQDAVKSIFQHDQQVIVGLQEQLRQFKELVHAMSQTNINLHKEISTQFVKSNDETVQTIKQTHQNLDATLSAMLLTINQSFGKNHNELIAKLEEQTRKLRKSQNLWAIALILVVVLVGYLHH